MKIFLVVVVVLALCWFGITRFGAANPPVAPAVAPQPATAAPAVKPAAPAPVPTVIAPAPSKPTVAAAKPTEANSADAPQFVLENILGPDNLFHDDLLGVSATLPEGWKMRSAQRWGQNNRENTLWMAPDTESTASPSMYYQMYPEGKPAPDQTEAYLREVARKKEASRTGSAFTDYRNVPESFAFTEINGNPALTYFATFNRGDQVMTEYFVRILGQKGYVMFFTMGKFEDVKQIMPPLQEMAGSVKVP